MREGTSVATQIGPAQQHDTSQSGGEHQQPQSSNQCLREEEERAAASVCPAQEEPSVDDFHDCETSDGTWMSSEDIESMCRDMSIRSASATAEAILEQTKETILQLQCQRDEYRYEVGSLNVSLNERDELLEECDDEKIKELRAQVSRLKRRKHN